MSLPQPILRKIENAIEEFGIPGLGLVVISPKFSTIRTFGYADIQTKRRIDKNSLWQLASVSKNISATCLAWMVEKGGVRYTSRVNSQLDNRSRHHNDNDNNNTIGRIVRFKDDFVTKNVNIKDCMSHTTGLGTEVTKTLGIYGYDLNTIYNSFKYHDNVGFRTLFYYNDEAFTLGFQTACCLLNNNVHGEFKEFFENFDMNDTTTDIEDIRASKNRVISYIVNDNGATPTQPFDISFFTPAGGVASTLSDLHKFLQIHLQQKIKGLNEIYSKVVVSGQPNGKYYGIGTAIENFGENNIYFHEGLYLTGVSHIVLYDITNQIAIVILTNSVTAVPGPLAFYIYLYLLGNIDLAETVYTTKLSRGEELLASLQCTTSQTYFKHPAAYCSNGSSREYNHESQCTCKNCKQDALNKRLLNICTRSSMTFYNDKFGQISIRDMRITVGRLSPAKINLVDGTLFFVVKDVDNQPNQGLAQFAIGVDGKIVLNTIINCQYALYHLLDSDST